MKARRFGAQLAEAAQTLSTVDSPEPVVSVRNGTGGPEYPVKTVKVRRGHIIIEF